MGAPQTTATTIATTNSPVLFTPWWMAISRTRMEAATGTPQATKEGAAGLPPGTEIHSLSQLMDDPPKMKHIETFSEKFYRKFKSQPLVPIGCVATAYFLVSGIKSFKDRDPVRSQKMMRARVGAQFVTLCVFIGYLGYEQFDLRLAPSYQDKKARERNTLEQQPE